MEGSDNSNSMKKKTVLWNLGIAGASLLAYYAARRTLGKKKTKALFKDGGLLDVAAPMIEEVAKAAVPAISKSVKTLRTSPAKVAKKETKTSTKGRKSPAPHARA